MINLLDWRRKRDSNPRYGLSRTHAFQACTFNHSVISPAIAFDSGARINQISFSGKFVLPSRCGDDVAVLDSHVMRYASGKSPKRQFIRASVSSRPNNASTASIEGVWTSPVTITLSGMAIFGNLTSYCFAAALISW